MKTVPQRQTIDSIVEAQSKQIFLEGGLEIGGKENTKQTNELQLRALKWALPDL